MTDNICSICFDEIEDKSILNCKHEFCNECLSQWFDRNNFNCHLCRVNINYYHNNNNIISIIPRNIIINETRRINHPIILIRTMEVPIIKYYLFRTFTFLFLFYFLSTMTIIWSKMEICNHKNFNLIEDEEGCKNNTQILFLNEELYDDIYNDIYDTNYSCIMDCL